jgi:PDZ domain-containing protein
MNKGTYALICTVIVWAIILVAIFDNPANMMNSGIKFGKEIKHEIRTYDGFKQVAFCPTTPMANCTPVALTSGPPIGPNAVKPALIAEMGVEAIQISGGKVKITGVMGNSWAAKAGLKRDDIVLSFNGKKLTSLSQFQGMLSSVPPEANYKMKILSGAKVKKVILWVGEGEMEGFTPILPVAFTQSIPQQQGFGFSFYKCSGCGNAFMAENTHTIYGPNCPICATQMMKMP